MLHSDSEERKLKDLTLEARHSLCLELAKKRRQSVGASIFIPKDDSKLKMSEKREKSANILTKTKEAKRCVGSKLGKFSKKKKLKGQQKAKESEANKLRLVRPQSQLKHPESFPIVRQTVSNEKIRSVVQILREQNSDDNTQTESEDALAVQNNSPDMPNLDCTLQANDDEESHHTNTNLADCEIIHEMAESPYVRAENENIEFSFYTNFGAHTNSEVVLATKGHVGEEAVERGQMTANAQYVNYVEEQTMNNNATFLPDYSACNRVPPSTACNVFQKGTPDQTNFSQPQCTQLYYTAPPQTTQRVDIGLSNHRPIDHVARMPLYVPNTHDSRTEYNYPIHMSQMHPALLTHRQINTTCYPPPYPSVVDSTTHQIHRQAPAAYLRSASMHWTNQRPQETLHQPAPYHNHEMPPQYSILQNSHAESAQMYHNFIDHEGRAWYNYNTSYTNREPIPYGLVAAPNLCTPRMSQNVLPPPHVHRRRSERAHKKAKAEHWSSHQLHQHHNTELLNSHGYHQHHSNGPSMLRSTPIDLTIRHEQRYSKMPLYYPNQLHTPPAYPALHQITLENTRVQGVSSSVPAPMNASTWHQIYDLSHHDYGSINAPDAPYQYAHAFERSNLSTRLSLDL